MSRPIKVRIDLAALRHNYSLIKQGLAEQGSAAKIWSVVKADAYGHGLRRVARSLSDLADGFALLEIDAAIALRDAKFTHPILLLEGAFDLNDLALCADYQLTPVFHHLEQLQMRRQLKRSGNHHEALPVYLKLNTGMNRLGFTLDQLARVKEEIALMPTSSLTLITHFSHADEAEGIHRQMERFEKMKEALNLPIGSYRVSTANSAALLRYPESAADWVRPGLALYGASPFADQGAQRIGLKPAMTFESEIIAVQTLTAGERVGYGGTFVARHSQRIGVVACGYADGYPRSAPNGTPILVDGCRTTIIGRVSMDLITCDLGHLPNAKIGSRVVLWGEGLPADEVAAAAGTISYELFCALAKRVPVLETLD